MHTVANTGPQPPAAAASGPGRAAYLQDMHSRFWRYWRTSLGADHALLEPRHMEGRAPPVFRRGQAAMNLLLPPSDASCARECAAATVPAAGRHRWFASMSSSQALAQSVFGSLAALGRLEALDGLLAEDGHVAFFEDATGFTLGLEHAVATLGEPRPTSLDALLEGPRRIAVEVKLTEADFGRCSRPRLTPADENHERDYCNGNFSFQRGRTERCSLSAIGARYWEYVPQLFSWSGSEDHETCPISSTYQIVRNVMAACATADGKLITEGSHAVVVFDQRNPAFRAGGLADAAWRAAVSALRNKALLRRASWQAVASHLEQHPDLAWLIRGLEEKYGLAGYHD